MPRYDSRDKGGQLDAVDLLRGKGESGRKDSRHKREAHAKDASSWRGKKALGPKCRGSGKRKFRDGIRGFGFFQSGRHKGINPLLRRTGEEARRTD